MSYQKESFGMMDEGYFVARGQILDWLNEILDLNLTKIQQLGAGSVYCQVVDVIHPGKVAMNKVNWKAKNDYEFIGNMKILQTAFDKAGVKRYVQVQKLAKAKYQDNLQFIQWLKRYYDLNCGDRGSSYNAQQRRGNVLVDFGFAEKNVVPKSFNSGGQMIGKSELPGKKTPVNLPIKSSNTEQKVQVKPKIQKKKEEKVAPKTEKQDWQKLYKKQTQKNKELNLKLDMIRQILSSEDDAQLKVAMLEQIMGSNASSKKTEKMQIQQHQQEQQPKQEEDQNS